MLFLKAILSSLAILFLSVHTVRGQSCYNAYHRPGYCDDPLDGCLDGVFYTDASGNCDEEVTNARVGYSSLPRTTVALHTIRVLQIHPKMFVVSLMAQPAVRSVLMELVVFVAAHINSFIAIHLMVFKSMVVRLAALKILAQVIKVVIAIVMKVVILIVVGSVLGSATFERGSE